jgi:hypothetical protein
MSTGRAIQTVTVALKNRLKPTVIGGKVHARPPDTVKDGVENDSFLNLFLFDVLPNAAWRNQENPSRGGAAGLRPPLPLELRYLLTAYPRGEDDGTAHALLGEAMLLLHDRPTLSRAELRNAMNAADPLTLTAVDVQFEQVKVCQMTLPLEEVSKLWTAFGTHYRLSVAYQVSVVLIDPVRPSPAPLPVLRRGSTDPAADEAPAVQVGAGPVLETIAVQPWLPNRSLPARHQDRIVLEGAALGGATVFVRFHHPALPDPVDVPAEQATGRAVVVNVPATVPLGFASVAVGIGLGGNRSIMSNRLPLPVASRITVVTVPDPAAPPGAPVTVEVTVTPAPGAATPVLVLFGAAQLPAVRTGAGVYTVKVRIPPGATAANPAKVPVRVRIEGIDSVPLPDPVAGQPPPLDWDDPDQVVTLP